MYGANMCILFTSRQRRRDEDAAREIDANPIHGGWNFLIAHQAQPKLLTASFPSQVLFSYGNEDTRRLSHPTLFTLGVSYGYTILNADWFIGR